VLATSITFLTPLGALLVLGTVAPLVALLAARRRANRVRKVVGLVRPPRRHLLVPLASLVLAGTFLGVAAAQPVLERTSTRHVRTDVEVFFVMDVSRSMLAQSGTGSPTRLTRAKEAASEMRDALSDMPVGLASLTDRLLPHLFPSSDADVFDATLERSIAIERPPPKTAFAMNATSLNALTKLKALRFFRPDTEKRLAIVFTDGETQPVARARLGTLFKREPAIETLFVHVWGDDERVYTRGVPEPEYLPDPSSRALLDGIAASIGGTVYEERTVGVAAERARRLLREGPTVVQGHERGRDALAPYLAVAAFLPVGLLLWRRDR
jgi:hypothetical protein